MVEAQRVTLDIKPFDSTGPWRIKRRKSWMISGELRNKKSGKGLMLSRASIFHPSIRIVPIWASFGFSSLPQHNQEEGVGEVNNQS